ncbi:hypothetical protein AK830_g7731 [Neonectria ditissima]|uniref:Uncharacterized protein n=1 Tax=Neonectria ditissima TaxID=78410 RepID=A0A0P7AW96_9HYPO|nr:hypothetical protein AK830_g7731 [Neonectria ditissima]
MLGIRTFIPFSRPSRPSRTIANPSRDALGSQALEPPFTWVGARQIMPVLALVTIAVLPFWEALPRDDPCLAALNPTV